MREILFRGKRVDNGEWLYGDLMHHNEQTLIFQRSKENIEDNYNENVDPETIGQSTGLTDKNGVKIFEGDLVSFTNKNLAKIYSNQKTKIKYSDCAFWLVFESSSTALSLFIRDDKYELEVIGNTHN